MTNKLKIGILGGGGILNAHAPGFVRLKDKCEIVIAESDSGKHARIRKLLGDEVNIYGDYKEVLALPDVCAVDILLPHHLHEQATIAAAKAGKHVLVEKVMARNVEECDRMIEACREAGVTLTVCHDRRYDSDWQALKHIVDSGDLGEILFWKLEHNQNVVTPPDSWIRSKEKLGGGAIMSCLTHQIDALRWYGGEVRSVTSMSKVEPGRMEGESIGAVIAKMESGALALLSINWYTQSHSAPDGLWYEFNHVTGTKGEAYYMSGKGTFVKLHGDKSEYFEYDMRAKEGFKKVETHKQMSGHQSCIDEWVKQLLGEQAKVVTDGTESRKTVEVAEAAYRSEQQGKVVSLPL
ncbi:Gfo/Idh/MocA family oxidoreductase [Paenibacillus hemerocallicola]|uniref:Gfo/Idh/MocA family oxidoreductase n=1 Tax=Paenibacillus hemerocallicola TaxID=1172614 RepID=A0A5C4TAP9_9BACL|nr:Gfo/Idh/MocA family oxidoreductase [Paenibacillus hemerocallicola]TNJ65985.1 Gfo/Idh/MocA family oxidoreductase [Paenibacillus hemerocallicola]